MRACRVRPDVPAVARAFDYLVPDALAPAVRVGAIVRVPLHGRRVRGWVIDDDVEPGTSADRLVPVHGVVSAGPPASVMALAAWAAWRWAGPLTTFLRAASPPTVVAAGAPPVPDAALHPVVPPPADLGLGGPWPDASVRVVAWPPGADRRALVASLVVAEGSSLVLVPEPARAGALVAALAHEGREVLHLHAEMPDRARSAVWDSARRGARVVVGGRASVWLPLPDLAAVVVLDEHDEAYQDERAPTWHARDVAVERARRSGAVLTLVDPAPGPDAYAVADAVPIGPPPRARRAGWPRLDVVDLREEPPGTGALSRALGPALHGAVDAGARALVVVNRRGRARILACRACASLARCAVCGSAVGQPDEVLVCRRCDATRPPVCVRCGGTRFRAVRPGVAALRDEVQALVPRVTVDEVDGATPSIGDAAVLVGTEAVLHRVARGTSPPPRLVAFVAFDEELLALRFRAHEQALALLARAARILGSRAAGGRLLVQTRLPDHPVLAVAAGGDPSALAEEEAQLRRTLGFPPFGAVAELSGAGPAVDAAVDALRATGLVVTGATGGSALVRAPSPGALADGFAAADLAPARALGRLRVAVDPPRV